MTAHAMVRVQNERRRDPAIPRSSRPRGNRSTSPCHQPSCRPSRRHRLSIASKMNAELSRNQDTRGFKSCVLAAAEATSHASFRAVKTGKGPRLPVNCESVGRAAKRTAALMRAHPATPATSQGTADRTGFQNGPSFRLAFVRGIAGLREIACRRRGARNDRVAGPVLQC